MVELFYGGRYMKLKNCFQKNQKNYLEHTLEKQFRKKINSFETCTIFVSKIDSNSAENVHLYKKIRLSNLWVHCYSIKRIL